MGTNYDAWLEQPFQDACSLADDYDNACELFANSDSYWEAYEEWASPLLKADIHCSTEVWEGTADYEQSVGNFWNRYTEPEPMPDDHPYNTRGWG
jgi:hypothetical protein